MADPPSTSGQPARRYNVAEAADMIRAMNLGDVDAEMDSAFEGFTAADLDNAEMFVEPPLNANAVSDEDSGSETEDDQRQPDVQRLNGRQLQADAQIRVRTRGGPVKRNYDLSSSSESLPSDEHSNYELPATRNRKQGSPPRTRAAAAADTASSDSDDNTPLVQKLPARKRKMPKIQLGRKRTRGTQAPPRYVPAWVHGHLSSGATRFPWQRFPYQVERREPTETFELWYSDAVVDEIVTETNLYAKSKNRHSFTTNRNEIRAFITILIISGYNELSRYEQYWSCDDDVHNAAVSSLLSKNRYEAIMQNLQLAHPDPDDPNKFAKVWPLFEAIRQACLRNFCPQQDLSVDEPMVPYYGRNPRKQFIRGKPIRFGYKIWAAATAYGYIVNFFPYAGAGSTDKELGLGGSVVTRLVEDLPQHGNNTYHITFDNLFTSVPLLRRLSEMRIAATGTFRSNRTANAPLRTIAELTKEPRGSHDYALDRNSGISMARWNDNSVVTLASTYSGVLPMKKCTRYSHSAKARVEVPMPNVVKQYNLHMGGVDRFDQNVGQYSVNLRSKKWWWPLFRWTINLSINNAWHTYNGSRIAYPDLPKLDQLAFRRTIVNTYLKRYASRPAIGRPCHRAACDRVGNEVRFDGIGHLVESGDRRNCALCGVKARFECTKCHVALHPATCFTAFHT